MFMMFVEIRTLTMDSLTAGLLQLALVVLSSAGS